VYTVDIAASAAAYTAASAADKDSVNIHPIVKFNGDLIAQLEWAWRQEFTFRGHTLVWHNQTPVELFRSGYTSGGTRLTKEKMIQRLDNYIKEVIRLLHEGWPGLLSAIDVVNEAVNEDGSDRTDSEWYVTFGDNSYLLKAFELTRQHTVAYGETQIKLYYNDYNTHSASKADGIVRICTPIFQAGYLDGIGMQDHDSNSSPTAAQWIATYNKFEPICSEMAVTELDVTTGSANPSAGVLATQANQYGQLFKCFVERSFFSGRGKIISVSKDGLNDQYTFKTNQASSLWDVNNQCKPAFYAVVDVGNYYNALDSLTADADILHESDYTTGSWSDFATALTAAHNAMDQNYSASASAAEALGTATVNLETAIDGLVKIADDIAVHQGNQIEEFTLGQNYPNPFNPITTIEFSLSENCTVHLAVYDVLGRTVADLVKENYQAGNHKIVFNASNLVSGVYFYKLEAGKHIDIKKLMLLK
jgi:GH35 family endo-1,4-beta-xylanase